MYVIEQPLPAAPAADSDAQVLSQWNAIYDAYNEVACLILGSMTPELHRQFENSSPYDMIKELKAMFENKLEWRDLIVGIILNGLTKDFAEFMRNYNMHNMGKTIGELQAMLIEYEKGLHKKAETSQVIMIKSDKIQKAKKKSLKAKGKGKANGKGNDKQVYIPKPKIPKLSAKEHPAKDDTCHHCKEVGHWKRNCHVYLAELLKKKKQVGSASSSDNCHYAPSITRGVVSVHRCTKRAKHNLDSTYLWHCRFAHISKKRIEKLQYEGLLKSTDDESFDQCVSCLSGKILRKLFLHHLERATDPLGIIHSDVCGPLKHVSRQGASYFITFTDDYSRYGYVYLLKHKHEDYALESTTRILNMVPTKKVDKTPYELCVERYAEFFEKKLITQEVSRRAIDLEEIQDEDTSPSEITSKIPMEVEGFEPPQEEVIPVRRSERTHRAPDHLCLNVEAEEHSLGDLNESNSYKVAMLDSESNKWIDAMNTKIQSMMDNMVWVMVDLPPGYKTVGTKGYTQLYGVDYEETFSPVADIRAIRILISIAAYYDYEIWQMDVKTAFLNGYLDEDIYMVQPEGFVDPNHPRKVCKLQRSIYDLKQTSRSWNKRFDKKIKRFGFDQNLDEPCIYQKASGSNVTFLILYVDDIIIMGNHIPSLQSVKDYLGKCFAMKDLGEATFILGIKIYRDRSKRLIRLGQNAYMDKILKRNKMDNFKCGHIPMQERLDLNKTQGASTPKEVKRMQNVPYALAVGFIMYVVRCTKPDVPFAQNITSRFQQNPGESHGLL
ncbi:retrotransposon protein, putative, ty1-copia subclass [Tanacetum coccineum]